ncbi:hypothetical protein DICPUDRAFT_82813 [Dictyostelium purpureum]|uniref:Uncharacterized protein n=1 Tax=Dictyostelium purpureum TaxID=5786 RepID=F0ZXP3_DICPU|nr:uncharacterized protein DICPUDRAFT_82813 [Dictyostelium purpureum]EGC31282.1 hypothetical protein DICPUDRAFT_82813 [Dictyostelium purpureum]|eukprot:XP_003292191.1 hypothetical protein DICPUDRAFT_82813 [Dictyostelium purpureum]
MCDITTNLQNKLKDKIQANPKEPKNYFSLALNIGLFENTKLHDEREYDKIELFKHCLDLDPNNSEYYFEIGQYLKYSETNETTLNNFKKIKEIDCYLYSIYLIKQENNKNNNNDNNKKFKKQTNRYYIALADALLTNNNNEKYKSIINSNNIITNKELKLEVVPNNKKQEPFIETFDKTEILLEAIEYCPERSNAYIKYMSNFLEAKKSVKLLNGKTIKIKDNINNTSYLNILMNVLFIIGIIFNVYYLFFK